MSFREELHQALNGEHPRYGGALEFVLMALIIFSVVSIGLDTLPDLPGWLRSTLFVGEIVTVAVFSIEYVARLIVAPNKWRYATSFHGIVDLLAIAPFYIGLLSTGIGLDFRAVRVLRLFRLFRLFKLPRYTLAIDRLVAAWRTIREEAIVYGVVSIAVLYLCALIIYYCENEVQPEVFSSVLDAMWWAAITLTTVGYGDIYPVTPLGRFFTILMLFVALGIIAVPTGLIASALSTIRRREDEAEAEARKRAGGPPAD